jgi:hypothetical protein
LPVGEAATNDLTERGELLDGGEVFDELRELIEGRRRAKAVSR